MDAQRDEEAAAAAAAAPLLAAPAGSTRSPAADAHILSAAFLFVFAAYGAAQNLESTVNTVRPPAPRSSLSYLPLFVHRVGSQLLAAGSRCAGGRPGHRLAGDPVHLLHGLLGGRAAGGDAAGAQARARRRQQQIRALHPRQPRPDMVRASYLGLDAQCLFDRIPSLAGRV